MTLCKPTYLAMSEETASGHNLERIGQLEDVAGNAARK